MNVLLILVYVTGELSVLTQMDPIHVPVMLSSIIVKVHNTIYNSQKCHQLIILCSNAFHHIMNL